MYNVEVTQDITVEMRVEDYRRTRGLPAGGVYKLVKEYPSEFWIIVDEAFNAYVPKTHGRLV